NSSCQLYAVAMSIHDLPAVNASLNAISGVLLVIGYALMRARKIDLHRRVMIGAFAASSLFLVCYVVYHAQVGSVRFTRQGFVRPLYFKIGRASCRKECRPR